MRYGTIIRTFGKATTAKYLRDKGCKFADKALDIVHDENSLVLNNREGDTYIVEECLDE